MKSEEKEPMQMRAQSVIQPRSEMPASRPAERKSILIGDREAIEHVESEVSVLKEKRSKESITPCKNKKSYCTGSAQMARAESGAKEIIMPCKNKNSSCTGSAQMARAECGAKESIMPCNNKRSPCTGVVQMARADSGGAFDVGNF